MSLAVTNSVVMDRWINEPLSNFSVSKNLNNVHFYLDLVLLASESLIPITTDMISTGQHIPFNYCIFRNIFPKV